MPPELYMYILDKTCTSAHASDAARCLSVGVHEKRTYQRPFMSAVRASLTDNSVWGPCLHKKIKFGIGGDAISRCLEGLTCTLQSVFSRSSVTFSIPPPPHHTLTISMQIWTNYETHILKSGVHTSNSIPPSPWLHQWLVPWTCVCRRFEAGSRRNTGCHTEVKEHSVCDRQSRSLPESFFWHIHSPWWSKGAFGLFVITVSLPLSTRFMRVKYRRLSK